MAGLVDHRRRSCKDATTATSRRARLLLAFRRCAEDIQRLSDGDEGTEMPIRLKKLIATVLLVALVIVYALVATTVAAARLADHGPLVHLAFFFFTGILWILPAMGIIKWLMLPPRPKS
jgi:hypothetical protein